MQLHPCSDIAQVIQAFAPVDTKNFPLDQHQFSQQTGLVLKMIDGQTLTPTIIIHIHVYDRVELEP